MFEKNHNKMEREFPFMPEVIAKIAERKDVDGSKFGLMFKGWPYYAKIQKVDTRLLRSYSTNGFNHGTLYWGEWWQSVSFIVRKGADFQVFGDVVPPCIKCMTEFPDEETPADTEGATIGDTLRQLQSQGVSLTDVTHIVSIQGESEDTKGWALKIDIFKTKGRCLGGLLEVTAQERSHTPRQKKIKRVPRSGYQEEFEKFLESLNGNRI